MNKFAIKNLNILLKLLKNNKISNIHFLLNYKN